MEGTDLKLKRKVDILKRITDAFDGDAMTQEDFIAAFIKVLDFVKKHKETTDSELENLRSLYTEALESIRSKNGDNFNDLKQRILTTLSNEVTSLRTEARSKWEKIQEKIDSIKNGKDADEERVINEVLSRIKLPEYKETVLDDGDKIINKINDSEGKIDAERVDLEAFEKKVNERIDSIPRGGGGTSAIGVAQAFKYIAHTETLVGNVDGVNTEYYVKNNIWWIAGLVINGEIVAQLPNFTFIGKKITFSSPIPADYSGSDIECKYIGV